MTNHSPPCMQACPQSLSRPLPESPRPVLLDNLQTSSQPRIVAPVYDDLEQNVDSIPFEHRGWHHTRVKVFRAMESVDLPWARRHKFLQCGEEVHVYQHQDSGEVQWRGTRCNDRFCMHCGQIRSHRIAAALEPLIRKESAMFLTFTVRGKPGDSLAELIETLKEGWRGLRRLPYWKERIRGGAIMLEIKWSATSGGHWHPHFHMVAHGQWIDQDWLRRAWSVLTRGSFQCDVQRVVEVEKTLSYVVKYASKPMDASFTQRPHLLQEAIRTLKGQRLCACFGSWYGTPLREEEHEDDPTEILTSWQYCGTQRDIEMRACEGSADAVKLLAVLVRARALRYTLDKRRHRPPDDPTQPLTSADDLA